MTIPLRCLSSEKRGNMTDAAAGSANGSAIYWEEGAGRVACLTHNLLQGSGMLLKRDQADLRRDPGRRLGKTFCAWTTRPGPHFAET